MRFCILILGLVLAGSTTALGQSRPRLTVISAEVESSARAELRVPPAPVIDTDTDFDDELFDPRAEAEAEVDRFLDPRVSTRSECDWRIEPAGASMRFGADHNFFVEDRRLGTASRVAAGEWRTQVVFEIDRPGGLHLRVLPSRFDDITYDQYEPGRLTGPDGVVVSGVPASRPRSWTWTLELAPGRYTFEAFADFEVVIDDESSLSDRATHDVTFSFRPPRCRPDLDADRELTIFDFLLFQNYFDAASPIADFDDDGELTIFDFLAFQNAFDAGCD